MASSTIISPAGASNRELPYRRYARANFGVTDPSNLGLNGIPNATTSPNATPPPLTNLLTVVLDPTWYALNKDTWQSPLQDRLPVTFIELTDGITENSEVNYADTPVMGRAEMYKTYTGTQNRELSLMFQFRAQGIQGENAERSILAEVVDPAKWLDALKYPGVRGELNVPPPPVIVVLGQLLVMRAVATAVSIRWGPTFDPSSLLPLAADVEVTFTAAHAALGAYDFERSSRFATFQPPSGLLQPIPRAVTF